MRAFEPMRLRHLLPLTACVLIAVVPANAATTSHRGPTSHKTTKASLKRTSKPKVIGQRSIDDARAAELQKALIKAGYLSGSPTGHWDSASEAAMSKLQADNGWQTKLVPDSRAIIKLGLGPGSAASTGSATPVPPSNLSGEIASGQQGVVAEQ